MSTRIIWKGHPSTETSQTSSSRRTNKVENSCKPYRTYSPSTMNTLSSRKRVNKVPQKNQSYTSGNMTNYNLHYSNEEHVEEQQQPQQQFVNNSSSSNNSNNNNNNANEALNAEDYSEQPDHFHHDQEHEKQLLHTDSNNIKNDKINTNINKNNTSNTNNNNNNNNDDDEDYEFNRIEREARIALECIAARDVDVEVQMPYYVETLRQYRSLCEARSLYKEAHILQQVLRHLRLEEETRHVRGMTAQQMAERTALDDMHREAFRQFHKEWNEKIDLFEETQLEQETSLLERQNEELEAFYNEMNGFHPHILRYSKRLIEVRCKQHHLARQRDYLSAHEFKRKGDDIEERDGYQFSSARSAMYGRRERALQHRHEQELVALRMKVNERRCALERQRKLQLDELLQRYINVRREMEMQHRVVRSKTGNVLLKHACNLKSDWSGSAALVESVESGAFGSVIQRRLISETRVTPPPPDTTTNTTTTATTATTTAMLRASPPPEMPTLNSVDDNKNNELNGKNAFAHGNMDQEGEQRIVEELEQEPEEEEQQQQQELQGEHERQRPEESHPSEEEEEYESYEYEYVEESEAEKDHELATDVECVSNREKDVKSTKEVQTTLEKSREHDDEKDAETKANTQKIVNDCEESSDSTSSYEELDEKEQYQEQQQQNKQVNETTTTADMKKGDKSNSEQEEEEYEEYEYLEEEEEHEESKEEKKKMEQKEVPGPENKYDTELDWLELEPETITPATKTVETEEDKKIKKEQNVNLHKKGDTTERNEIIEEDIEEDIEVNSDNKYRGNETKLHAREDENKNQSEYISNAKTTPPENKTAIKNSMGDKDEQNGYIIKTSTAAAAAIAHDNDNGGEEEKLEKRYEKQQQHEQEQQPYHKQYYELGEDANGNHNEHKVQPHYKNEDNKTMEQRNESQSRAEEPEWLNFEDNNTSGKSIHKVNELFEHNNNNNNIEFDNVKDDRNGSMSTWQEGKNKRYSNIQQEHKPSNGNNESDITNKSLQQNEFTLEQANQLADPEWLEINEHNKGSDIDHKLTTQPERLLEELEEQPTQSQQDHDQEEQQEEEEEEEEYEYEYEEQEENDTQEKQNNNAHNLSASNNEKVEQTNKSYKNNLLPEKEQCQQPDATNSIDKKGSHQPEFAKNVSKLVEENSESINNNEDNKENVVIDNQTSKTRIVTMLYEREMSLEEQK